MAKMNAALEAEIKAMAADDTIKLIVWTAGDATPHLDWFAAEGIEVRQQYKLKPGVAVTCSAAGAQKLIDAVWVVEIKEDGAVHTQ